MQNGGTDIIELGVPFSDPVGDGPAIQETNNVRIYLYLSLISFSFRPQIAIQNGIDYHRVLDLLKQARAKGLDIPVILMGKQPC
jgi:tryptophan synthase